MVGPRHIFLAMFLALFAAVPAVAGGVPMPAIPKAKGAHCVRPVEWMRQNHMKLLMQLRYAAVHQGIRSKQESLPGCMSCHVSKLADGSYPAATSRKFFCNACHAYAGVSIDCFSCHTNRPDGADRAQAAAKAPLFAGREAGRDAAAALAGGAAGLGWGMR